MKKDCAVLNHPEIVSRLFYPRKEFQNFFSESSFRELNIPVAEGITIGARFYSGKNDMPTMLFFHGNGEIVADYADMAQAYAQMGINFFPVDYRGYGRSTGAPSATGMMSDCHVILDYVRQFLLKSQLPDSLIIMGRSLGSASALELAGSHADVVNGLIIESGFAHTFPLLDVLGIPNRLIDDIDDPVGNLDKIKVCGMPTLIIHAEFDHIIPFSDAEELFQASPAQHKNLLKIKGANHNDLMFKNPHAYLKAIESFVNSVAAQV